LTHAAAKVYQIYQQTLKAYQAVDFDDLIKLPVELFQPHARSLRQMATQIAVPTGRRVPRHQRLPI
jgi:superfamily I DNA/RNA helicase